jgi:hypothetical protein
MEGTILDDWSLIQYGWLFSGLTKATKLFVVPKSMPITVSDFLTVPSLILIFIFANALQI